MVSTTAHDRVCARLAERTGGTGRNGSWPCPAHDDNNPSLSVSQGRDGNVLVHCHAGCATADVLAALDLDVRDLFDKSNGSDITATYDYVDETGTLLFQVVRKSGKQFRQRRPDANGGWVWKLGDTRRVLYRLPEVVEGVADGATVFVVEGEKDADRLTADGCVATTNPHGAGKWRSSYNATLEGADVVIVADKDEAGRAHARDVALALGGVATSVRVVEAAEGKDVSDHLGAGRTVEELVLVDLEEDDADVWPQPAPLGPSAELLPFPVDAFPGWVRDHVVAVSEFTQTPVDLPAVVALAALSTAAGGRVVVEVRGPWREPTNLFLVAALPPGSRKSAVFAEVTRPLLATERDLVAGSVAEILEAETLKEIAKTEAAAAAQAAAKAEGATQHQLRDEAVSKAEYAESIVVPVRPRLIADDVTPEAAASLLAEQRGRLGVLSAEGGIFHILAGRYSSAGPSLEVFLKGHAGDMLRVDRKGRAPEHIPSPALTVGLTVQPEVIKAIAGMPGFRGRGLLARILYSLPENTVGRRRVGVPAPAAEVAADYETNLGELVALLHEWTDPAVLTLTREAAELILDAERRLEPRLAPHADLGHIADWASKLIGATARIAGLLHLAEHRGGVGLAVTGDTMAAAIRVGEYFTGHALAVFDAMGADPAVEDARVVLDWIERTCVEEFTRRDAQRGCRRFRKVSDLEPALEVLEDHGFIRGHETVPDGGGPRSRTFEVNPHLTGQT